MNRINYPNDTDSLTQLHNDYFAALSKVDTTSIDAVLSKALKYNRAPLTLSVLSILPLKELLKYKAKLKKYFLKVHGPKDADIEYDKFEDLFNYQAAQPTIAKFFMQAQDLELKICKYCGIDHINAFKSIGDYRDEYDFLNRAPEADLVRITGIKGATAKRIIQHRKNKRFTTLNDISLRKDTKSQLSGLDLENDYNHFTLDHVLPQSKFKFLSLCLYNLVPSCYSCNSKLKGKKEFVINKRLLELSPTSPSYTLRDGLQFRIYYQGALPKIKSTTDFILDIKAISNKKHAQDYIDIFLLRGRYAFHKDIVLKLIEKHLDYPPERIRSLALQMGKPDREIREMIYGTELFDKDANLPMQKMRYDIAKALRIIS